MTAQLYLCRNFRDATEVKDELCESMNEEIHPLRIMPFTIIEKTPNKKSKNSTQLRPEKNALGESIYTFFKQTMPDEKYFFGEYRGCSFVLVCQMYV